MSVSTVDRRPAAAKLIHAVDRFVSKQSTALAWPGVRVIDHAAPGMAVVGGETAPVFCFAVQGHLHITSPIRAFVPGPGWGVAVAPNTECILMTLGGNALRRHLTLRLEIPVEYAELAARDVLNGRSFTPAVIDSAARSPRVTPFCYHDELSSALSRFLRSLEKDENRTTLTPLYFEEVSHLLYRTPEGRRILIDAVQAKGETDPVHQAVRYIRNNLTESISVTDLARQVRLSPSAFAHSFRQVMGTTPYQYVKGARLDTAKSMLINDPEVAIADVAQLVGYTNPSHFISEFKRRYRVTPREFTRSEA